MVRSVYGIGRICILTFFVLKTATAKIYNFDGAFGRVT